MFDTHTLTNQGVIAAGSSGGHFNIGTSQSSFINSGSITVSNGDSMAISAITFANSGKVNVLTGATLSIGALGNQPFSNTGTISETNATIILNGTLSLADIASIKRTGRDDHDRVRGGRGPRRRDAECRRHYGAGCGAGLRHDPGWRRASTPIRG